MTDYRLGVDVGGTNTDAVILDRHNRVLNAVKSPTTSDVSTGISKAIKAVLEKTPEVQADEISYAMLGTTQCTNAIVERKQLNRVAILRIGAPATLGIKPLLSMPQDLRERFDTYVDIIHGGHEFNGELLWELDEEAIVAFAEKIKGNVDAVAVTSVFAPVSTDHEKRAFQLIQEVNPGIPVSLSNEIGSIGLLDRENATILNASLIQVAQNTANGFKKALKEQNVNPKKVFFSQNDGTLMNLDYTMKYPILTIACGPTNSLRGASFLGEVKNAVTVDVGGTTTDIGILQNGFPRESSLSVEIGGVRTNFRMPDVLSVGLGGGTIIHLNEDGSFQIGPESVGYQLEEKALVFGGDTLTATDVAAALGHVKIGDTSKTSHLDQTTLRAVYDDMTKRVEEAIDKMKTSSEPVPVVLVGGGSSLFPDHLEGAKEVIRKENGDSANAVGAAIASVSGQIEQIFMIGKEGRGKTVEKAKQLAVDEAVRAGAQADAVEVVYFDDVPLAYLPGDATKISVKAAGPLK